MVTVHTQHHGSYNVASNEVVISDIGIIVSEHGKPRRYFPDGEVTLIVEYVEGDNTE